MIQKCGGTLPPQKAKIAFVESKKIMFGSEMVFFEFFFLPFLSKNLFLKTNPLRLEGVC
jgi:hypothetical protein